MSKRNSILLDNDSDYWYREFEKNLQKSSVQSKEQISLFDQINSVINGVKSKYPSVQAAVDDMKERSGLTAYLQKQKTVISESSEDKVKTAEKTENSDNTEDPNTPIVIKKCPQILNTLENFIRHTKGNLPLPSVIDKIRAIHRNDITNSKDWEDDNLMRLVSRLNLQEKAKNPSTHHQYSNLGVIEVNESDDQSNSDAFSILQPAKY